MNRISAIEFYSSDYAKTAYDFAATSGDFGNINRFYSLLLSQGLLTNADARVFDIGIGSGLSVQAFAKAGHPVSGIDGSNIMLDQCKERGIPCHPAPVDIERDMFPAEDASQDIIISNQTLYLVEDLNHVFAEAARIGKLDALWAFNISPSDSGAVTYHSHDVTGADRRYQPATTLYSYDHPSASVIYACRDQGFSALFYSEPYVGYTAHDGRQQRFQDFIFKRSP